MTPDLKAEDLGLQEEEPLDVLDLPQLYTRPSAASLLFTLSELQSEPSSWASTPWSGDSRAISGTSTPYTRRRKVKSEGIPAYLTKIISSALQWIEDDAQKEQIWETAAHELSVRSGRTAQGDLTRSFTIPLSASDIHSLVELWIYEPALTADNLGHKTWASSFMLAQRLCRLKDDLPTNSILELGAGTGLVGMAAACVLCTHVVMTDLPEIVPNLERNLKDNAEIIGATGGTCSSAVLDWRNPECLVIDEQRQAAQSFSLIVAADMVYSQEHPRLLTTTIEYHMRRTPDARLVVEVPLRDAYDADLDILRCELANIGLTISQEGSETGIDDWSSGNDDQPTDVKCWWSVWKWS
ncbi:hypothetical protein AMS68_002953 [Peltaster fructicola]|uniref:FAM86 N-terminal domain-containing protein n=1 Tax=Peltaster fructicola TaxID=286661 RepID=A0A6H0XRW9_9PEZI|nr:hypothetical protein AMS68_002953 [Peltaster fructicola]